MAIPYEPVTVGSKVKHADNPNHTGVVKQIRPAKKPAFDDGDEALVQWHKGYASWTKVHNLVLS